MEENSGTLRQSAFNQSYQMFTRSKSNSSCKHFPGIIICHPPQLRKKPRRRNKATRKRTKKKHTPQKQRTMGTTSPSWSPSPTADRPPVRRRPPTAGAWQSSGCHSRTTWQVFSRRSPRPQRTAPPGTREPLRAASKSTRGALELTREVNTCSFLSPTRESNMFLSANQSLRVKLKTPLLTWSESQNHASRIKKADLRRYLWLGLSLTNLHLPGF